jgi:hypothetical protein
MIKFVVLKLRMPGISGSDWLEGDRLVNGWAKKSRISRISSLTRQNAKVLCEISITMKSGKRIAYSLQLRWRQGSRDP